MFIFGSGHIVHVNRADDFQLGAHSPHKIPLYPVLQTPTGCDLFPPRHIGELGHGIKFSDIFEDLQ